MKILLALFIITLCQAVKVYNCGSASASITFSDYGTVQSVSSDGTLSFSLKATATQAVKTDYVQIRAYGGAPEFTTTASRKFSQFQYTFQESALFGVDGYADFINLPRATYKVQVDVFDANDDKVGCGYFFANQDLLIE